MDRSYRPAVVRTTSWDGATDQTDALLSREWIVTNGLGGYASGTLAGAVTRRYHGLLIAALPAPLGRAVMWNYLADALRFPDGETISIAGEERAGLLHLYGAD